jgi:hypothetical protein
MQTNDDTDLIRLQLDQTIALYGDTAAIRRAARRRIARRAAQ